MRTRPVALVVVALAFVSRAGPSASQPADKATEIIAAARRAIGDQKLDALKTLSVQAAVQRNVGAMQLTSDTEMLLELPDKYVRSEVMNGPMSGTSTLGFNGDKPLQNTSAPGGGGGGLIIRIGPGGGAGPGSTQKLTPDEQEKADRRAVRSMRQDLSRLMLGWFAMTHPSVHAQYTYVGEAESADGKAFVIEAKNDEGFTARLFIDEQTHLPLMVTYQGPQLRVVTTGGPGGPRMNDDDRRKMRDEAERQQQELQKQPPTLVDYTLFFDEWRDVGGIQFPHRIRRAMAGATNEEWTISKVKINPKIDPKKFEG